LAVRQASKTKNYDVLILIIWALIFPLAFSFGRQKLHYFIVPIYPACALLVGLACDKLFRDPLKPKIAAVFGCLLIIPTVVMLCFPIELRSKHFRETVILAPVIDQVLKEIPEYEFFVYHQDAAALLFYSQQLTRVNKIEEKKLLEEKLSTPNQSPRFCYISEKDYALLSPAVKDNFHIVLKCKDKLILTDISEDKLVISLPG
jgi:hypothetical protein